LKNLINQIKAIQKLRPGSKLLVTTKDNKIIEALKAAGIKGTHRPHEPKPTERQNHNPYWK
jgi:hypothetical protein